MRDDVRQRLSRRATAIWCGLRRLVDSAARRRLPAGRRGDARRSLEPSSPAARRALGPILLAGAATMLLFAVSIGAHRSRRPSPSPPVGGRGRAHRSAVPLPVGAAPEPARPGRHQPCARGGARRGSAGSNQAAAARPERGGALPVRRAGRRLRRRRRPAARARRRARPRGDPDRARRSPARGDRARRGSAGRARAPRAGGCRSSARDRARQQPLRAAGERAAQSRDPRGDPRQDVPRSERTGSSSTSRRAVRRPAGRAPRRLERLRRTCPATAHRPGDGNGVAGARYRQAADDRVGGRARGRRAPRRRPLHPERGRRVLRRHQRRHRAQATGGRAGRPPPRGSGRRQRGKRRADLQSRRSGDRRCPRRGFRVPAPLRAGRRPGVHPRPLGKPGRRDPRPSARRSHSRGPGAPVYADGPPDSRRPRGAGNAAVFRERLRGTSQVLPRRADQGLGSSLGRRRRVARAAALVPAGRRGAAPRVHAARSRSRWRTRRRADSWLLPELASCRPATRSGGGSSETSTTARSSAWSRCPSRCGSPRRSSRTATRARPTSSCRGERRSSAVALEELRELARGIHPAVLTERGLGPALASLADRTPLPVALDAPATSGFPRQVEAAAYFVVSEALANVAKYADASRSPSGSRGKTAKPSSRWPTTASAARIRRLGSGLVGLADRVEALDGHLRIESKLGEGTTIRAEIPCR